MNAGRGRGKPATSPHGGEPTAAAAGPMRVLVACEFSGVVRDAFRARGHDAWSCDLLPTEADPAWHLRGDVLDVLAGDRWDALIAFPPCDHLSKIGAASWARKRADGRQASALGLVRALMLAPVRHIAIENPAGRISTALRPPDQVIHPYQFGDPWYKQTCLWLAGLPPLRPTLIVEPTGHWVDGGPVKTGLPVRDRGVWSGPGRARARSRTFPGIAAAMADQWGGGAFTWQPALFDASELTKTPAGRL